MNCLHCGAEVNGLALCQMCRAALLNYLEFLPVYFRNLSRWRPSPSGRRRVPGSREPLAPRESGNDRIGHRIDEAHADITGWLRPLADDRPYFAEQIWAVLALDEEPCMTAACKLLEDNVDSLCTLPWVGDLLHSVQHHEWRLREETERSIPGWYAGACSDCDYSTFVVPGLTWVTCQSCGKVTNVSEHLPVILKEARGWVDRPRRLAEVIVAMTSEESVEKVYDRIRQAAHREDLVGIRKLATVTVWDEDEERFAEVEREVGHPHYRFGDVLDALASTELREAV